MNVSQSRRLTATIVLLSLGCFLAPQARAIRYELIDQGADKQNGHTLSGFIEFESACGTSCSINSITDFSFTVTGTLNYSYSFQQPLDAIVGFGVNAGPQLLTVDRLGLSPLTLQNYAATDAAHGLYPGWPYVGWSSKPLGFFLNYASVDPNGAYAWISYFDFPEGSEHWASIGKVIPEPTTWLLSISGILLWVTRRSPNATEV